MPVRQDQAVVLVHGLWLSGWAMALIARRLRRCGFRTYCFCYPSVRRSLRENAAALRAFSDRIEGSTVHYLGHSLGGVIIQAMFAYSPPARAARVVTLASPHAGSRIASALMRRPWGRSMLGASIADLLRGELPRAAPAGHEIGVIKGDRPVGLGRLFGEMESPNDGVLGLDETHWPGATDEISLTVSHTEMLFSREAARRACQFLRFGYFIR